MQGRRRQPVERPRSNSASKNLLPIRTRSITPRRPKTASRFFNQIQTLYPTPAHAHHLLADLTHLRSKKAAPTAPGAATGAPPPSFQGVPVAQNPSEVLQGAPAAVPAPVKAVGQAKTPDDALKLIMSNYSSVAQDATKTQKEKEDAAYKLQELRNAGVLASASARSANARPVHIGDVTPQNAITDMHTFGYEYDDENGQPITEQQLSEAPPGSKLVAFRQGKDTFYKVMDQNEKNVNIGGIAYAVAPLGPQGPQTMTPLGTAEGALTREHQVPGMNPGEKINLTSGPTATPGITTAAPVSASTPQPPGTPTPEPTLKTRLVSTATPQPPSVGATNQTALNAKLNGKKSQSKQVPTAPGVVPPPPPPFAPGTMLTQGRSAQPVVASMNTVAAQVFGGDGEKPIWENAYMFDNPGLRTALNKALTLNALSIPGTEDDPSFMQTLATAAGITGWSQQQIQQANVQARQDLQKLGGDDALNMFARMAGMQEDLSALRAATKGSAAQGSIRTLVRAAPVYNVESSKNFRDQLAVTLNTASAAMSGYPAINPAYLEWFKKGAQMARGASPVSSKTPSAPGQHTYAIDDKGKRHKVLDPKAALPLNWKWAD